MKTTTTARRRLAVGLIVLAAAAAASVGTIALSGSSASPDRAYAQTDDSTVPGSEEPALPDTPTISVTGTAEVTVTPDTAHVSMGVRHRADSAKAALDTVSRKTTQLIDTLTGAGVLKADIQTTNLAVWPSYGGENGERITGYEASNSVTVKTSDLAGLGALIDEVSGVVGDQFTLDGVSFSVADPDAALADVRGDAIADARTKAEQFVAGEDLTVGSIRHIVESGSSGPPIPIYERMEAAAADLAVPIEPGQQELSVTVTVIFDLA
jgi:uncharacterized protein YggE